MTEKKLNATLQKSYYGKARIFEDDNFIVLHSYDTDVIAIDKSENKIVRLWSGWSRTTAKHINDFLTQYGHNAINKAEWARLPCVNPQEVYSIYISTGFVTSKSSATLTAQECENTIAKIRANDTRGRLCIWYD